MAERKAGIRRMLDGKWVSAYKASGPAGPLGRAELRGVALPCACVRSGDGGMGIQRSTLTGCSRYVTRFTRRR